MYAASFHPPAVPASTSGPPAWVLLNTMGYIADCDNATRAEALTSTGHPIAFSFFPAEPPGVTHFCVHCRGNEDASYSSEPTVVHSDDNLALLTACVNLGRDYNREYFLYRASRRGKPQSLEPLLGLHDHLKKLHPPHPPIAVVPCDDGDGEHFVLAAIGCTYARGPYTYDFHVFRSKLGTWKEQLVTLPLRARTAMDPEKVIVLGCGEIGWVDLRRVILVRNLLDDDDPEFRVIPLPTLLPVNRAYTGSRSAEQFRDVVCVDGVIKLVEIEHCRRLLVQDVSKQEVLYDQDLALGEAANTRPKDTYEYTGWRLVTWTRMVSSNCWRRGSLVHVDDVVIAGDVRHSALLPGPGLVEKSTGKTLRPYYPTLSMDGTDVVYLKCKVEPKDRKAWLVALDMSNKTIQHVAPFPDGRSRNQNYNISCALFKV